MTAVVFLLIGLAITFGDVLSSLPSIAWGVLAILVGRALVVYAMLGPTSRVLLGRRLPTAWLHVLFWAGLRGAVAIAMALSLPLDFPQRPPGDHVRDRAVHAACPGHDGRVADRAGRRWTRGAWRGSSRGLACGAVALPQSSPASSSASSKAISRAFVVP